MISKIHKYDEDFIVDGGLTLKLAKNNYLVWKPSKEGAYELLEGKLDHVGAVKNRISNFAWRRKDAAHNKDSHKYFLKIDIGREITTSVNTTTSSGYCFPYSPYLSIKQLGVVYYFERKDDENIIEKIMYHYKEGDNIRILYKDGHFKIEDRNTEIIEESKCWSIVKDPDKYNWFDIFHYHPLTDKTFETQWMKRSSQFVCQGCNRRAPKYIKFQYKLLKEGK